MAQLEAMIAQISTQAAPVARQVGAKAAELAAVAAVKAGPAAQRAAVFTTEYGQRFAEKAQSVASELRSQDAVDGAASEAAPDPVAEAEAASTPRRTRRARRMRPTRRTRPSAPGPSGERREAAAEESKDGGHQHLTRDRHPPTTAGPLGPGGRLAILARP